MLDTDFIRMYVQVGISHLDERSTMSSLDRESLAKRFLNGWSADISVSMDELQDLLCDFVCRAQACWPLFAVSDESFMDYLTERVDSSSVIESLKKMNAEELWLVHAVLQKDQRAIVEFDNLILTALDSAGIKNNVSRAGLHDFLQHFREVLLVNPDDRRSRLATFTGRGSLLGWIKVVLSRDMSRFQKTKDRNAELATGIEQAFLVEDKDPELLNIKKQHRELFRSALFNTIEGLEPEERLMLRYWIVDSLTMEQIGFLMKVNRVTARRRIERLRRRMLARMKIELSNKYKVGKDDLASLMRSVASRFDESLNNVLS